MPSSSAVSTSAVSSSAGMTAPVGLAGLANSTPFSGFSRCAASEMLGVQIGGAAELDLDDLDAERRHDVAIGGIAGRCDGDAVAGSNIARKARLKAADEPVVTAIAARRDIDARSGRHNARRSPCARPPGRARRCSRCGRPSARWPPLPARLRGAGSDGWPTAIEMTGTPVRLQPVGFGQHVHGVERLDIAAARKRNNHLTSLSPPIAPATPARAAQMPD